MGIIGLFQDTGNDENVVFPNTILIALCKTGVITAYENPSKEMNSDNDLLCMGIMLSFVLNIRISGS